LLPRLVLHNSTLGGIAHTDSPPWLIACNSTLVSRAWTDALSWLVGFDKALYQASYLFRIHVNDPRFDIDKYVYERTLMSIDDIPRNTEATTYVDKPIMN